MAYFLSDFNRYVKDVEAATTYQTWAKANCGGKGYSPTAPKPGSEVAQWRAVVSALQSGATTLLPIMSTSFGKSLVDVAQLYIDATAVAPPPPPVESPDKTTVPPATSVADASGHIWTIAAGKVAKDGVADPVTGNVVELAYVSHVVWQKNSSGYWYAWTGTTWSTATTIDPTGAPPPPPPPAVYGVGVSSHFTWSGDADAYVARLAAAGFKLLRDDMAMSWMCPSKGVYDFSRIDQFAALLRKYKLKGCFQIGFCPPWANGNAGNDKVGPLDPADFGAWAAAIGKHVDATCADVIVAMEYWNEPNIQFLINPTSNVAGDPLYYTKLANAAYDACKAAGVKVKLWAGSTAGSGQRAWNEPTCSWAEDCLKAGIKFDEWSCHAYYFKTGMAVPEFGTVGYPTGFNMIFHYPAPAETLDKLLARYGYSGPIHSTETGVPTDAYPSGTRVDGGGFGTTSEAQQAAWFEQVYPMWRSQPRAGWFCVYTGQDGNSADSADREQHFGAYRSDFSAKPLVAKIQAA